MASNSDINKIAMIGCGAMGGGMALLFAEKGCDVFLRDPSNEAMKKVLDQAKKDNVGEKLSEYQDNESLCKAFGSSPKVFVWSLPHGHVGDTVLDGLMPFLKKDDIIIDCANEHWENTERRIGKATTKGIRYVGMGVSGGYQAARRGPSMCPGTDSQTFDIVMPLLRKAAAKAPDGSPCVGRIGTGGAGHYCKMIHNGIEHGMMSAICEAWAIMKKGLGMSEDEVGDVFNSWNAKGELQGTVLIRIGAEICKTINKDGERVLDTVEDKVVQDVCGEEGTGIWSNTEAIDQHIPGPTLTAAHYLRLASADLHQRRIIQKNFGGDYTPQKLNVQDKTAFLEDLRLATYSACLAAYIQGMNIIDAADKQKHFNVDYYQLLQIWRAGCIIQADYISSKLLMPHYKNFQTMPDKNPLYVPAVAKDLQKTFAPLKNVVLKAVEADHVVPSLSSTLDYLKYMTSTDLPTSFQEAELDYFGRHMFDVKGQDREGLPSIGKHHYEWKPA
ncbi:hypothetical protein AC578_3801 [Pseudocercospora eumusae]|uniref:6-phosphogluconate dehydrogenase, decarboxylating n=1 Tax=Pseudocercospora eumusae TaxID=321146 RepID=A0A139HFJ1_9PEZI|nr:hypothetical protein AC578_3801 [Pseudocercospora eumusae]